MSAPDDITQLLQRMRHGDADAQSEVVACLYRELHDIARRYMRRERGSHTLQTTGLVHELWMRIATGPDVNWQSRTHFLCIASKTMRRVLVDYARMRGSEKRGGGAMRVEVIDQLVIADSRLDEVLMVDEALDVLAHNDPGLANIVELRYFGGLSEQEAAEVTGVSARTIRRDLAMARAWLNTRLSD